MITEFFSFVGGGEGRYFWRLGAGGGIGLCHGFLALCDIRTG